MCRFRRRERSWGLISHAGCLAPKIYKRQLATALTYDVKMLIARDKRHAKVASDRGRAAHPSSSLAGTSLLDPSRREVNNLAGNVNARTTSAKYLVALGGVVTTRPMVPPWHATCQLTGGQSHALGAQALARLSHTKG
jgi:hypothetical protein